MKIPKGMVKGTGRVATNLRRIEVDKYARYNENGINLAAIARHFGVSRQCIAKHINGKELDKWYRSKAFIPIEEE